MKTHLHFRHAIVAMATAATLVTSAPMAVQASEIQRSYAEHTSHCLSLLFSDKAAHDAQCLPNTMPDTWTDHFSTSPVVVPPPPAPPVIVVEPPEPPDCEFVGFAADDEGDCGKQYT